jgi:hypothetical protein
MNNHGWIVRRAWERKRFLPDQRAQLRWLHWPWETIKIPHVDNNMVHERLGWSLEHEAER